MLILRRGGRATLCLTVMIGIGAAPAAPLAAAGHSRPAAAIPNDPARAASATREARAASPSGPEDSDGGRRLHAPTTAVQPSLWFEANLGQAGAQARFVARGSGFSALLGATEAAFVFAGTDTRGGGKSAALAAMPRRAGGPSSSHGIEERTSQRRAPRPFTLRMQFVGANPTAAVVGQGELPGKINYFNGRDPAAWRAGVPTYERVLYRGLYPGVDLLYHAAGRQLEYDFVVAPGADTRRISLRFDGAARVRVDGRGDLVLHTPAGEVRHLRPVVYQQVGGARRGVTGRYLLKKNGEIGFRLGVYDRARPLIIDPVIAYATTYADTSDIAVDKAGNIYVTGRIQELGLPTVNAAQGNPGGSSDAFVTKFNPSGTQLIYSTYLGGGSADGGNAIAVDSDGNAYVAGTTEGAANNFPVKSALQPQPGGGPADAFLTKLSPTGQLVYSTYLGGGHGDSADDVAVDASGNAYVAGATSSPDFPTRNAVQPALKGNGDFFLTKVNAAGSSLEYSTYLGGSDFEAGAPAVAVDAAGAACLAGYSYSTDFPTKNALQPARRGDAAAFTSDAVVLKLSPAGTALLYSTYLGGGGEDVALGVAADGAGNVYVTGLTSSPDFPARESLHPLRGQSDVFVTKISAAGDALIYSTYLGGGSIRCPPPTEGLLVVCGGEEGVAVAADGDGNAYVTGGTAATDFPLVNPIQTTLLGYGDAFVTKLNPKGAPVFSTYLGGTGGEAGIGIALGVEGGIYVTGPTTSSDFPTVGAFHETPLFRRFGFVALIAESAPGQVRFSQARYEVAEDARSTLITVTRSGDTSASAAVDYTAGSDSSVPCEAAFGLAVVKCDLSGATSGTLSFAPGEVSKTFRVFVTDDARAEGPEVIGLTLHNARGAAALAAPASTALSITDDDVAAGVNPIDDPTFFVRQHYLDFLNREPEPEGLSAWLRVLNGCRPGDASCDRVQVSSSFFRSPEFQQFKGYFVFRFYSASLGRIPTYVEFQRGLQQVTGATPEEVVAGQAAFAADFATRSDFRRLYDGLSPREFVMRLLQAAGVELSGREQLIADLESGRKTRAQALREVVESREVYDAHFNGGFVAMQYFGYLRRDPERDGFLAWLNFLNRNPQDYRTMVNGFVNSREYRLRFGPP